MNKLQILVNEAIDDCMMDRFDKIDTLIDQSRQAISNCDTNTQEGLKKLKKAEDLKVFLTHMKKFFKDYEKLSEEQLKAIDLIYLLGRKKYVDPTNRIEYLPLQANA